jgi:hypothetical protein
MLEHASLRGQPRAAGRARGPADLFADIRGVAPPPGGLLVSVRVAFQGELGSYSEAALAQYFEDYGHCRRWAGPSVLQRIPVPVIKTPAMRAITPRCAITW